MQHLFGKLSEISWVGTESIRNSADRGTIGLGIVTLNRPHKCFHRTLTEQMKLVVYETPTELRQAVAAFVDCYNHRRYHEGIGNFTPPGDLYYRRRCEILGGSERAAQVSIRKRADKSESR